jgi:hypothetical protein
MKGIPVYWIWIRIQKGKMTQEDIKKLITVISSFEVLGVLF